MERALYHTLVVSDVHLATLLPGDGDWLRHRRAAASTDIALASAIDQAVARSRGQQLEIVLNGDIFDFDAPHASYLQDGHLPPHETYRPEAAAAALRSVLDDHPLVVRSLRAAAEAGQSVVVIPGNHDAQIAFESVRSVIRERLPQAVFRTWFHHTPYGAHIEHGHLYDPSCTPAELHKPEPSLGSVGAYYAPALSPGINPHVTDPIGLPPSWYGKALRETLANGRTFIKNFAEAASAMTTELGAIQSRPVVVVPPETVALVAQETGTSVAAVATHAALLAPRWSFVDFARSGIWRDYHGRIESRLDDALGQVAKLYGSTGVVVGHTHRPFGRWRDGVFFGNSGTWAPGASLRDRFVGSFVWLAHDGRRLSAETMAVQ